MRAEFAAKDEFGNALARRKLQKSFLTNPRRVGGEFVEEQSAEARHAPGWSAAGRERAGRRHAKWPVRIGRVGAVGKGFLEGRRRERATGEARDSWRCECQRAVSKTMRSMRQPNIRSSIEPPRSRERTRTEPGAAVAPGRCKIIVTGVFAFQTSAGMRAVIDPAVVNTPSKTGRLFTSSVTGCRGGASGSEKGSAKNVTETSCDVSGASNTSPA